MSPPSSLASTGKGKLVAFDLDGTLTRKDTLTEFLVWRTGLLNSVVQGVWLLPALMGFFLGRYSRSRLKVLCLRRFIKGVPVDTLEAESNRFAQAVLPKLLRKQGLECLRAHVAAGDRVFLVTASPEFVAQAWARAEDLEFIATRLEVHGGRMTGKLDGVNCRGLEKVRRLGEILGEPVSLDVAYGDSAGDTEMLAAAREAHFRPFRDRAG